MGYVLGIDLGTTCTIAAVCRSSGRGWAEPEVVPLGSRTTAAVSLLSVTSDGSVMIGEDAERHESAHPDRAIRAFARRVGDTTPIVAAGRTWAPEQLSAQLVRWVVDRVAEREGGPADGIAITHPASWEAHQVDLLARALAARGLTVTFLTGPEAAALHYATAERVGAGSTIAVYDLGGGTFDAAVVRTGAAGDTRPGPTGFGLLGRPEGRQRLGGIDFDEVIFEHVKAGLPDTIDNLDDSDPGAWRIRRDCAAAKEALSIAVEVSVSVALPAFRGAVRLQRGTFEEMISARIEETVEALHAAIISAGLTPTQLTAVLLVGGSCRIPLVARLVSERLGRPVTIDADLEHAIAKGAAAALRVPPAATSATAATDLGPDPGAGLTDDAQFTVYRPARIRPMRWYPLLVFAHRADPYIDPDTGELVDPLDQVVNQANQLLRDQSVRYRSVINDAEVPLPRGAEIVMQPWLADGEVNPAQASLRWEEPTHRVEFRLRAAAQADGRRAVGGVRVFLGAILVAEVSFTIAVAAESAVNTGLERIPVQRFRRIFASYSHLDANLVRAVADYTAATGDRYMIDTMALRSGERWEPRLIELIDQSDIFQLFWSRNAMNSAHVRREWEHALSLQRDGFIRPVYWEDPRPVDTNRELPPEAIDRLHWARLPVPPIVPAAPAEPGTRADGSDDTPPDARPTGDTGAPQPPPRPFPPQSDAELVGARPLPPPAPPTNARRFRRAPLAAALAGIGLSLGTVLAPQAPPDSDIVAAPPPATAAPAPAPASEIPLDPPAETPGGGQAEVPPDPARPGGGPVPATQRKNPAVVDAADCRTASEDGCQTRILEASRAVWPSLPAAGCSVNESRYGVDRYSAECSAGGASYLVFWREPGGSVASAVTEQMVAPTPSDFRLPDDTQRLGTMVTGTRSTGSGDRYTCVWEYDHFPVTMMIDGPNDPSTVTLCNTASFLDSAGMTAALASR